MAMEKNGKRTQATGVKDATRPDRVTDEFAKKAGEKAADKGRQKSGK